MADYPMTKLDRAVDRALARVNAAAIAELKNPKPVACDICGDLKWTIVFEPEVVAVRCVCNPDPGPEATERYMAELIQAIHDFDWDAELGRGE